MNTQYYSNELKVLQKEIVEQRSGKGKKGVLLLQENASVHSAHVPVQAAADCRFEPSPHSACSPDQTPSDCYRFPRLKNELGRAKFSMDDPVIAVKSLFWEDLTETFNSEGLKMLKHRWDECIFLGRYYAEK